MAINPETFPMRPIGVVHTPWRKQEGTPIQGSKAPDARGEIEVFDEFAGGIADIEGFSHIILLFVFHEARGFELRVRPYMDREYRGVFATRAPRRPNPIGLTVVRLLGRNGNRLTVGGVDMLDGTPLLDIKPYVPDFDPETPVRCGWLDRVRNAEGGLPVTDADDRFET